VLEAAFAALGLQRLMVSKAAMREGILYDMLGRGSQNDPRDTSVASLTQRYGIDEAQSSRVEDSAMRLFQQVAEAWGLDDDDARQLGWAARLHEIGLAVAHSQYHVHGSYLLEHSDIAGFSRQEQQVLATLVRTHRRSIPKSAFDAIPDRLLLAAKRKSALLRLAVLLHRAHLDETVPTMELTASDNELKLVVSREWVDARPLLRADLLSEPADLDTLGVTFKPFVA